MKVGRPVVILLFALLLFTARPYGQENDKSRRGSGLSLTATATPASIITASINPNNKDVSVTNLTTVSLVRLNLRPGNDADVVKKTPDGTLFLNRLEIFVRFSGYRQETATVQLTVSSIDDATNRTGIWEGASPEASKNILHQQTIKIRGVKNGQTIIRYVGFRVSRNEEGMAAKTSLGGEVKYEIAQP